MKSQQAAEREEQQRIKNLVLNYELNDDDQHDGTDPPLLKPIVQPLLHRRNLLRLLPKQDLIISAIPSVEPRGMAVRPEHEDSI